jgi:hypothetical protein
MPSRYANVHRSAVWSSHLPTAVSDSADPLQSVESGRLYYQPALREMFEHPDANAIIRGAWKIRHGHQQGLSDPNGYAAPGTVILGLLPDVPCCFMDLVMLEEALLSVCIVSPVTASRAVLT